jgi:S-DNA-T family DNA segregation ATPase FtsK/SpoIIIE
MAKRKKRRDEKKDFPYIKELYGVVFVLLSILGLCRYGLIGKLSAAFAIFLVGNWYIVLLILSFILGIYLFFKREWPKFMFSRFIGIYLLFIGILVLTHMNYVTQNNGEIYLILKESINDLMLAFNNIMHKLPIEETGGGILGALFGSLFNWLFEQKGTFIVAWVIIIFGIVIFTGFSIFDIFREGFEKSKKWLPKNKKELRDSVIINDNNMIEDENNKIVISSIDEINKITIDSSKQDNNNIIKPLETEYKLPQMNILTYAPKTKNSNNQTTIEKNIIILERVLRDFGVIGKVVEVNTGPTVTQYELELQAGTKVSRILSIHREISLALAKKDVRIQAPIPGKSTIGIEIPNDFTTTVSTREILEKIPKKKDNSKLLVALGKNIMGDTVYAELDKMPHLLVAGATGSGKSVCINVIIASILMRTKPDEIKLVLIDPKKVELSVYNGMPHLLIPVVNDPKAASKALGKIVKEMENRYDIFNQNKVKNITDYNEYIEKKNTKLAALEKIKKMPYIVVIVDELADLMLVASKDVEEYITRITQLARAAGIHLIIATQRPSTDVITGLIKANIPSRISFAVSSSIDSRTILDMTGAEKLLGRGDMLFLPMGESAPIRLQGAYISDREIKELVEYTVSQQQAIYDEKFMNNNNNNNGEESFINDSEEDFDDPLYDEILEFVITTSKASASLLQRRFKIGYNRAARLIDLLEERGIVGPMNGSKPREVLYNLKKENE